VAFGPMDPSFPLMNTQIAELLAVAAETEEGHRRRAIERAARAAMFTWTEEAAMVASSDGRSLTELVGVGPWMARRIDALLEDPPDPIEPPEIRRGFLSRAEAHAALESDPAFVESIRGDLQMHTTETDGAATLDEMLQACQERGYSYAAITDHSKELKIVHGM